MMSDVQKYAPDQKPDGYFESLHNVDLGGLLPPVTYGSSPNQRVPSRDSVIFAIVPAQPAGVKALSSDFTGGAAQQSQF
jgi:hypothetical protein